jgi:hypothetical protein
MPTPDRIDTLKHKHAALEAAIQAETARPHPDDDIVAQLKRQKLKLKDTITGLVRP